MRTEVGGAIHPPQERGEDSDGPMGAAEQPGATATAATAAPGAAAPAIKRVESSVNHPAELQAMAFDGGSSSAQRAEEAAAACSKGNGAVKGDNGISPGMEQPQACAAAAAAAAADSTAREANWRFRSSDWVRKRIQVRGTLCSSNIIMAMPGLGAAPARCRMMSCNSIALPPSYLHTAHGTFTSHHHHHQRKQPSVYRLTPNHPPTRICTAVERCTARRILRRA